VRPRMDANGPNGSGSKNSTDRTTVRSTVTINGRRFENVPLQVTDYPDEGAAELVADVTEDTDIVIHIDHEFKRYLEPVLDE